MSKKKEAYVQLAGYINRTLSKAVRLQRDKTKTKELDKAKTDADTALLWLNVLVKLADAQATVEQPTMFETEEYNVGQGVKVEKYY